MYSRHATLALAPFVRRMWASEESDIASSERELVLPTGLTHLVVRLSDAPLRLFESMESSRAQSFARAVIGGARSAYYVRDLSRAGSTVGAELLPGAAQALFGTPASALAGMHTLLEDCWSRAEVETLRDRLAGAPTLETRVDLFETMLCARLPAAHPLHPLVAHALSRLMHTGVRELVRETGYSHRGFNNLFAAAVGMSPKLFARVRRFEAALERIHRVRNGSLAALALEAGYSDQSHYTRDFRAFAGLTPGRYRAVAPRHPFHVPLL